VERRQTHHSVCLLQLQQYQYYSAGLLSTYDPFYEQQRHLLGPKKKKFKEDKKLKGKYIYSFLISELCVVHFNFW
jgi:hypothetical protein